MADERRTTASGERGSRSHAVADRVRRLDEAAALQIIQYLSADAPRSAACPRSTRGFERFFDESGGMQLSFIPLSAAA